MVIFVIFILVSISLHEAGHYITARHYGIVADEFNIGLGPRLCGFTKGGTKWNLRLFPFGGSCVFGKADEGLNLIGPVKRIIVLAAGPFVNLLLGLGFIFTYNFLNGNYNVFAMTGQALVQSVVILPSVLASFVTMFNPAGETFVETSARLVSVTSQVSAAEFFGYVANLGYILNILLFSFNMLPIPALDGGQILFSFLERIGHPVKPQIIAKLNAIVITVFVGWTAAYIVKEILSAMWGMML